MNWDRMMVYAVLGTLALIAAYAAMSGMLP